MAAAAGTTSFAAGGSDAEAADAHTRTLASMKLSSALASKTMNARRTMVRDGALVCVPFATSSKPFKRSYPSSIAYGKHDTILNPPNKERMSTYKAVHSRTAVTGQSAGSTKKLPVPYKPEAPRSRVRNDPKRLPPPFASTLSFESGVTNKSLHPFRTMNEVSQAGSTIPMTERLGFTNAAVTSDIARRLHKTVYAS